MKESILKTKSFRFALDCISLYQKLTDQKQFVIGKQLLRSGTSIGANIIEANHSQSKADFIHKLYISQKECAESIYWLELLIESKIIENHEFEKMNHQAIELLKMIKSSILTAKTNLKNGA